MFNGPQLHLILNHFPIVGFALMTPLVLLVTFKCQREYKRLALIGIFAVSLFALGAYLSGEPAEEGVEDLPGIQEKSIHEHEEAAEVAFILALVTGALAAASWIATRKSDRFLGIAMPLLSMSCLASAGAMSWAGHEGGMIRHPEIRDASSSATENPGADGAGESGEQTGD